MFWVLDLNLVERFAVAIAHLEPIPPARDDRGELHGLTAHLEAQDFLHPGTVHPRRRTGIPGPAALTDLSRQAVNVGRDHVGLNPVAPDRFRFAGTLDRVKHAEELRRAGAVGAARR